MKALSVDLRERLVLAHQAEPEATQTALAQRFLTSQATVSNILAKHKKKESLEPQKQPGRPRKMSASDVKILEDSLALKNDRTLEEHVLYLAQSGIQVSDSTVSRELARLKQTRKKRPATTRRVSRKKPKGKGKNSSNG